MCSVKIMLNCKQNTLVWPSEVLSLPIRRTPEQLVNYLRRVPLPWFLKQKYTTSFTDKVIRILEEESPDKLVTLDTIANQLHITTSTLRRKLSAEGSSYKQLRDDIRRDRAIDYLSQSNISVAKVSTLCGLTIETFVQT